MPPVLDPPMDSDSWAAAVGRCRSSSAGDADDADDADS